MKWLNRLQTIFVVVALKYHKGGKFTVTEKRVTACYVKAHV